jgi:hypothetical protein
MKYTYEIWLKYAALDTSTNPPQLFKDVFPTTHQDAKEVTVYSDYISAVFIKKQTPAVLSNDIVVKELITGATTPTE